MSHADVIIKVIAFTLLCYRAEELGGMTVVWHKVAKRGHSSKELMARWQCSSDLPPLDTRGLSVRILSLGLFLELPQGSTCHSSLDLYSWPPCHILKGDEFCSDMELPYRPFKAPSPPATLPPHEWFGSSAWWGQETQCHVCLQSSPFCPLSLSPHPSSSPSHKAPARPGAQRSQGGQKPFRLLVCSVCTSPFPLVPCPSSPNLQHLETMGQTHILLTAIFNF